MNALVDMGHEFEHLLGFAALLKDKVEEILRGERGAQDMFCARR
jgi:hypothetical protein